MRARTKRDAYARLRALDYSLYRRAINCASVVTCSKHTYDMDEAKRLALGAEIERAIVGLVLDLALENAPNHPVEDDGDDE